jgi:hypothetical protein
MKLGHPCRVVAVWCAAFFTFVPSMCTQKATAPKQAGVPRDWSQRHIVFSRDGLLQHPEVIYQEPRVLHQAIQRWQGRDSSNVPGIDTAPIPSAISNQRDWSVNLPGRIALNMEPAKFSFFPNLDPSCANDYVVFGLTVAGVTHGTANLIAYRNLYSGTGGICGGAPTVLFAYNVTTVTGGAIVTSPVLSLDGKKIAFVESVVGPPAAAIFHVLTWTAGDGAPTNAADPNAAAPTTSMTSTPFAVVDSTTSSPFVDYANDIAYMGANDGRIYKITGVFRGTPTLAGAPWPILLSTNNHPTSPVLDSRLGMLMIGGNNGSLYQINTATGAIKHLVIASGATNLNHGILGAPIVDLTSGTTFVVSSNDGSSGVLVEVNTALLTELARGRIGEASHSGTPVNLYEPAFSDSYYNNPSTGVVRLCGTGPADITPYQYAFAFSAAIGTTPPTMQTPAFFSQPLPGSTNTRCIAWTEFLNPNIGVGGTDFFFFGLSQDCTAPGLGFPDGCVVALATDPLNNTILSMTQRTLNGGPSGIVVDNYSTLGQASSVYMMAARRSTAYKFTQNGLN